MALRLAHRTAKLAAHVARSMEQTAAERLGAASDAFR